VLVVYRELEHPGDVPAQVAESPVLHRVEIKGDGLEIIQLAVLEAVPEGEDKTGANSYWNPASTPSVLNPKSTDWASPSIVQGSRLLQPVIAHRSDDGQLPQNQVVGVDLVTLDVALKPAAARGADAEIPVEVVNSRANLRMGEVFVQVADLAGAREKQTVERPGGETEGLDRGLSS